MDIPSESLGRIRTHDPRHVWANEALAFTPWLETNIDQLNEAIGLEIELAGREVRVGPFAADLYGTEVQTGHAAIVENQLEPTDHGHLGQILTYAAGLKAGVVVWIARKFRDEHREALTWLNQISPDDVNFFGVEVEILEIAGQFAPNFKLVVQPNAWQKAKSIASKSGGAASERSLAYQKFFSELLEEAKARSPGITTASRTQPASWFWFASGRAGMSFSWSFVSNRRFRVELSIDTPDRDRNKTVCEALQAQEAEIQSGLDQPIYWDISETRRQIRLEMYAPLPVAIDSDAADLENLRAWAVPAMINFVSLLRPRLKALP